MADTKEVATTAVMTEYPARLQMSMLAPVRKMAELISEGDKEVRIIGYIFGTARGVSFRNNPNATDDEPAKALLGAFEGIPSYEDMEGLQPVAERARLASGVCFLPPQAQELIVAAILSGIDGSDIPKNIKRGDRSDRLGVEVPVSLEVGIRKSSSPVGYDWVVRGLANVKAQSPIDRMREALGLPAGASLQRAIADGTLAKIVDRADKVTPTKAVAAPAAAKGSKGKRK